MSPFIDSDSNNSKVLTGAYSDVYDEERRESDHFTDSEYKGTGEPVREEDAAGDVSPSYPDRVYDSYDYDDAYQEEGVYSVSEPLAYNPLEQEEQDELIAASAELDSQEAQSAIGVLVQEYEATANDYLRQMGLPQCAGIWAKKGGMTKADRDKIYEKLVAMRDNDPNLVDITGNCAFLLNYRYVLSMAWNIYRQNKGRDSALNTVQTIFEEYWIFNNAQWPRYDPARGSYTNFLTQGKHKVSHSAKENTIQIDSNKQYQFGLLRKAEIEIMSEMESEATTVDDLTLHKKTNLPMTTIAAYRSWVNARNPVELDHNIQASKASPTGGKHMMQPDDAAISSEMEKLISERLKALLHSLPPEKLHVILMKLGITDYGSLKNKAIAEIMHISVKEINVIWTRAKHKLRNDPEIQQWFGVHTETTKTIKKPEVAKTSDDYMRDSDEVEISPVDAEEMLSKMEIPNT